MAQIAPIRGLRYNTQSIPDLADVITPPYDVIGPEEQEKYYQRHPNNIIRLEYGKTYPDDNETNSRYTRAAKEFSQWQEEKVLLEEEEPAIYIYSQTFSIGGERKTRLGIMAGVKLEPYEKGVVLPHEETLPKHKADRLALMETCRANFSPIFSLYSDPGRRVEKITAEKMTGAPDIDFTGDDGQQHRVWVIKEPALINQIQDALHDKVIFIADGHHRYETALNYRNLRKQREGVPEKSLQPYDFVMMTLVNLYDPGLVILPTHRLVKNIAPEAAGNLLNSIKQYFAVEKFLIEPEYGNFQDFLSTLEQRGRVNSCASDGGPPAHGHAFGLYTGSQKAYIISLKDGVNILNLMPEGRSPAWCGLDVSVLHTLIMEKYLGIGGEQRASESNLTYTREEEGALKKVDAGEYQMIFFLNPTLVEEVTAVAANREKMPQKSTFFYPKLPTGLLINKF